MNRRFGGPGFTRPENALKRADELENVGQKHAALQALHDIITSKKHRTWSKTYESIMFKLIDLVVESKKRNYAKEALSSYRNMCQAVNIASLEEVIKYFLKKAGEKAEEAQAKASAVTIDVEDLEEDASPEDMMLSYVSADKGKDRTDRELVTPWFRFLWEAYRTVLDILRINPKLEALYAMTATKAFHFCLQYKRNMEFRRLCDILRQHLTNQLKPDSRYRDSREATPESLQLHLETRFEQLKVACELDLWAEAFRSVEDIQQLILLAKKHPKQQMMATYYARLTQIFAKSENHTYHAYAWLKLFNFTKAYNKNMTPEDLRLMACSVLLATLSILPYDRQERHQDENQVEQEKERIMHMANILGFAVDSKKDYRTVLSRAALLSHTTSAHILGSVPADVRQLYDMLTAEFNPLELCQRLTPLFAKLAEFPSTMSAASPVKEVVLTRYVDNLKQVAVLRLLKQLTEVYSTLKISSLAAMVPFATMGEIEAIIVDAVRYDYLQIRIDHRNGTLHFGSQQLESEKIRSHLSLLASHLSKAVNMIDPSVSAEKAAKRTAAIQAAMERTKEEHKIMNARKIMIEKRKEEQELLLLEQEKEEERRRAQAAREAEMAEERRRREDALRREKERIERELEEREYEEARQLLEQTRGARKGGVGAKPGVPLKEGEKMDKQAMVKEALSERLKEQQEMERKLAKIAKQLDHLERARREEEIPYLEAAYKARLEQDKQLHEEQQAQFLTAHRAAWEVDIQEKQRLSVMNDERAKFAATIMARREELFKALQKEREKKMAERAARKKQEREIARRREFIRRCCEQVEARAAEIEEQQAREAEERRLAEEEERQRKIQEQAERQRQREAEIEAKLRLEKEQAGREPPAAAAAAASASGPKPGAFVPAHLRARQGAGAGAGPAPAAGPAPDARDARDRDADRWGGGGGSSGGGAPNADQLLASLGSQRVNNIFTHLRKVAQHPLLIRNLYTEQQIQQMAELASQHSLFGGNCSYDRVFKELAGYSDHQLHTFSSSWPTYLSQFMLDPSALMTSAKVVCLDELLPKFFAEGNKVLLFSQWTMTLDLLEWYMQLKGFSYVRLDGNTVVEERLSLVDKFNDPGQGIFCFLLSTRAGGQGLNLTGADIVVLHDVDFNPQVDRQAEDRCHRLGQTKPVTVYRLVTKNTVDQNVLAIAERKLALDAAVLNDVTIGAGEDGDGGEAGDGDGGEGKPKSRRGRPKLENTETRAMGAILSQLLSEEVVG